MAVLLGIACFYKQCDMTYAGIHETLGIVDDWGVVHYICELNTTQCQYTCEKDLKIKVHI